MRELICVLQLAPRRAGAGTLQGSTCVEQEVSPRRNGRVASVLCRQYRSVPNTLAKVNLNTSGKTVTLLFCGWISFGLQLALCAGCSAPCCLCLPSSRWL